MSLPHEIPTPQPNVIYTASQQGGAKRRGATQRGASKAVRRRLYTLDVFTKKAYAGNPLAVVTDGDGISTERMQAIAREMNLAETVFVQRPSHNGALARRGFSPPRRSCRSPAIP